MTRACNVWIITEIGPFDGYMPVEQVNEMLAGKSFQPNTLAITTDDGTMYPILDILADTVLGEYQQHADYVLPMVVRKEIVRGIRHEQNN